MDVRRADPWWRRGTALVLAALLANGAPDPFHERMPQDRQTAHAIARLTFGERPGDVARIERVGVSRWIEQRLHPDTIPESDSLLARLTGPPPRPAGNIRADRMRYRAYVLTLNQQSFKERMLRAIDSERQLAEVPTDFWFDYFNVHLDEGLDRIFVAGCERDAIRPHVVARHPANARHLSRKLAQRFVADDPPASLVGSMAGTLRETGGEIRAVLRTMFASREFWSVGADRAKVRSPFEMVVAAARLTEAQVDRGLPLVRVVAQMGQPLYRKQEPTGYREAGEEWLNTAGPLARLNFASVLAADRIRGVTVTVADPEGFVRQTGGPEFQRR